MLVRGVAHPRACAPEHACTPHLSRSEIIQICSRLPSKPVLAEHGGQVIGVVKRSWMDGWTGNLMVEIDVNADNATCDVIKPMLVRRSVPDLSLRWTKEVNRETGVTRVEPVEVSVVGEGLMPSTHIVHVQQS